MTKRRTSYSILSRRAKSLLRREEGYDVEFKRSAAGLESSDITAFANSEVGGAILVGVADTQDAAGHQLGQIIGCPTGDRAKLQVLGKAMSCVPPVPIQIFVENSAKRGFLRIEIAGGPDRPYATAGGVYKIREDGRVRALAPVDLLQLLLVKESAIFEERFGRVTDGLIAQLESLGETLGQVSESVKESVASIASALGWTESKVDETASDISSTLSLSRALRDTLDDVEQRVISLTMQSGAPDPVKNAARKALLDQFVALFKKKPHMIEQLKDAEGFRVTGAKVNLFTSEEMGDLLLEAVALVRGDGALSAQEPPGPQ